ncbi:hypothetical protein QR680_000138 [Steinernema hermaphroditum]|uniref:Cathepsin propeptide inhibitor domain-containing protein n=1 Tax=Steinernema hermaphroditum TaxID=289476 RepID=A0AA39GUD9_9BILA|nr:hypothetical protein QR680_000138 [Steinernema hermaphroditum]
MRTLLLLSLLCLPVLASGLVGINLLLSAFNSLTDLFYDYLELQVQAEWRTFMERHQKNYGSVDEQSMRFAVFRRNMRLAKERAEKERGTARFGANKFSDMTEEEFQKTVLMNTNLLERTKASPKVSVSAVYEDHALPESFDWRNHNAVTEVKDQGWCGSCWAFSTTGNVESIWAVKKKQLVSLSEQQILDCEKSILGCFGGWPVKALQHIIKWGGLEPEEHYKYHGRGFFCHLNRSDIVAHIDGINQLDNDEDGIAQYMMNHGAVSVTMNARSSLMHYVDGIIKLSESDCSHVPDHAVLIVGFGTEKGMPYWIVKNSFGPKPVLYGVPIRRAIVDSNDPNHLRAIVENPQRRIPFDQLEPDKAVLIFASVAKNPLTRTTVDAILPYTKAPVNINDILRKRRSPDIPEFSAETKNNDDDSEKPMEHKTTTEKPSTKFHRKAKIMWASELDEDPFAIKETPAPKVNDEELANMVSQNDTVPAAIEAKNNNEENEEVQPKQMTQPEVAVIDSDAQFVPENHTVVRHLVANNLKSTIRKLRIKRSPSIVDSATENLDDIKFHAGISTTAMTIHRHHRTTMKAPRQRLLKSPNTSNFVALDNQSSREVVDRDEVRIMPKLVQKTTIVTTTEAPSAHVVSTTQSHASSTSISQEISSVIVDSDANIAPVQKKMAAQSLVVRRDIKPQGPPFVWNEFIIPSEGRRILVKSIPAAYFANGSQQPPLHHHVGVVQNPRRDIPVIESEAVLVRPKVTTSTVRPSTTMTVVDVTVSVTNEIEENIPPISDSFHDQVKSEDLQVIRIYEREGTTRTALLTRPQLTTPNPTVFPNIPRIVKPTFTHEAAMRAAARDAPLPKDVPVAKSDIADVKQISKSSNMSIPQRAANNRFKTFRARDFIDNEEGLIRVNP